MSAVQSLTEKYGLFFWGCAEVAVLPYRVVLGAFCENKLKPKSEEVILGAAACIILSTVIPILPDLTSITFAIAIYAASLALASMLLLYPIAILADALGSREQHGQFAY